MSTAVVPVVTGADAVALKLPVAKPGGTTTDDGTDSELLLLERPTVMPPVGAGPVSPTLHEAIPGATNEGWLQLNVLRAAEDNTVTVEPNPDKLTALPVPSAP